MNIMMNALYEIRSQIPIEILNIAFNPNYNYDRSAPFSLDNEMWDRVLKPRVMKDADVVGGQDVIVSLEGLPRRYHDQFSMSYEIPPERLNNRTILSVLSVSNYPVTPYSPNINGAVGNVGLGYTSEVVNAGQRVMDSFSGAPAVSNSRVDLIGHNTILIRNSQSLIGVYQVRCVVGNDENLSNINIRSYGHFATFCVLAVKAYIYNYLFVKLDQGFIQGGQELGAIKQFVDRLEDAEEQYQQYRETIAAVFFMNNAQNYERFLKLQISGNI